MLKSTVLLVLLISLFLSPRRILAEAPKVEPFVRAMLGDWRFQESHGSGARSEGIAQFSTEFDGQMLIARHVSGEYASHEVYQIDRGSVRGWMFEKGAVGPSEWVGKIGETGMLISTGKGSVNIRYTLDGSDLVAVGDYPLGMSFTRRYSRPK